VGRKRVGVFFERGSFAFLVLVKSERTSWFAAFQRGVEQAKRAPGPHGLRETSR
jgi:hypothetical protein